MIDRLKPVSWPTLRYNVDELQPPTQRKGSGHHSFDQRLWPGVLEGGSCARRANPGDAGTDADRRDAGRESVTEAALCMQRLSLIRYARGRILVLDRQGLEKACKCYAVATKEYDRL
jgi:hypothetical protein